MWSSAYNAVGTIKLLLQQPSRQVLLSSQVLSSRYVLLSFSSNEPQKAHAPTVQGSLPKHRTVSQAVAVNFTWRTQPLHWRPAPGKWTGREWAKDQPGQACLWVVGPTAAVGWHWGYKEGWRAQVGTSLRSCRHCDSRMGRAGPPLQAAGCHQRLPKTKSQFPLSRQKPQPT